MRPGSILLTAAASLAFVLPVALGQDDKDDKTPKAAPWNLLENAATDDWAFYAVHTEGKRGETAIRPRDGHLRVKVEDVGTEVKLSAWDSTENRPQVTSIAKGEAPTIKDVLTAFLPQRFEKPRLHVAETKDEKKKLGDREVECTRISGEWRPERGSKLQVKLWLAKDVKGLAVLAVELAGSKGALDYSSTYTLLGHGTADKTLWGEAPAKNAFGADLNCSLMAPGNPAPALEGTDAKGEKVSVDLTQKPVFIHFYSTWNDCAAEVAWLAVIQKAYAKAGLTVVGVASVPKESLADWEAYLKKQGGDGWTNVADTDGATAQKWHIERKETGSHATACIFDLVSKGKIAGGDFVVAAELWDIQLSTIGALKRAFPKVAVPDDLKTNVGE